MSYVSMLCFGTNISAHRYCFFRIMTLLHFHNMGTWPLLLPFHFSPVFLLLYHTCSLISTKSWHRPIADQERKTIRHRPREGIFVAKSKGKNLVRPSTKKTANWDEVVSLWRSGEITANEARKRLRMKKTAFYKNWRNLMMNKRDMELSCRISIRFSTFPRMNSGLCFPYIVLAACFCAARASGG